MMVRNIVAALVIAMLLPLAAYADCGKCGGCKSKCNTCVKSSCNKCESKCGSCKKSCCEKKSCDSCNKCSPCKSKCNSCNKCAKPSCNKCESKCGCKSSCKKSCCEKRSCNSCNKCNSCAKPSCGECKMPCACTDWRPYCGCEMIDSLCIQLSTCGCDGGTAGPLQLELKGNDGKTIATVQLDGPIDGSGSWNYKFAEPIKADSLREAVIVNNTDDSTTLTWFSVTGMGECGWSYNYFDKKCSGVTIGKDGCPRFVLF